MVNNSASDDFRNLYNKIRSSSVKLPQGIYPNLSSLLSVIKLHLDSCGNSELDEYGNKYSRVLDRVNLNCLRSGHTAAVSCGNNMVAKICVDRLKEYRQLRGLSESEFNFSERITSYLKSSHCFPHVERLLRKYNINSESSICDVPSTSNVSTVRRQSEKLNTSLWPHCARLLEDAPELRRSNATMRRDLKTHVASTSSLNQNYPHFHNSDVTLNRKNIPPKISSSNHISESSRREKVDYHSNTSSLINGIDNNPTLKTRVIEKSTEPSISENSMKQSTSKLSYCGAKEVLVNTVYKNDRMNSTEKKSNVVSDCDAQKAIVQSSMKVDNRRTGLSTSESYRKTERATERKKKSSAIRSSERLLKKESKLKSTYKDSNKIDSCVGMKSSDLSNRKGTPGVLKKKAEFKSNKKRLEISQLETPIRRVSILNCSTPLHSTEIRRQKRKRSAANSNSSLRPHAKRFRTVESLNGEKSKIGESDRSRVSKLGMADSCGNKAFNSMNMTETSGNTYLSTPTSTFSNRRGKMRILYKRNLFKTPKVKSKKNSVR